MYSETEPYERGLLNVGSGNAIYFECCGNRNGKPAVFLHGGPGSGCTSAARRFFDPTAYNAVYFDQRGCGRSRPLVEQLSHLTTNTTHELINDIESLRRHLHIERWTVVGVSWGTTLALAYAQACPSRIDALVLAGVTTTSRAEVDWITCDVGRLFPEQWERLASHIPERLSGERIVDAYAALLFDDDIAVSSAAAAQWCAWEDAHVSLVPGHTSNLRFGDPEFRLRFARIVTHYWRHCAFLEEDQLIHGAASLNDLPGVLIHGRYDVSSPLQTAWRLHKRWRTSELRVLDDSGHGGGNFAHQIAKALDQLKSKF